MGFSKEKVPRCIGVLALQHMRSEIKPNRNELKRSLSKIKEIIENDFFRRKELENERKIEEIGLKIKPVQGELG